MLIIWIVSLLLFLIIEAATMQLVTIWFALGSLGGVIAELCGAPNWLQCTIFVVISFVSLVATRPFVKKMTKGKIQPTNADRYIGETGVVEEAIDNTYDKGLVKVKGSVWTARAEQDELIEEGALVTVKRIEGVKLIVSRKEKEAEK